MTTVVFDLLKQILSGTLPVKRVPDASRHVKLSRFPRIEGKVPLNLFFSCPTSVDPRSLKVSREDNKAISEGIGPVNVLRPKSHCFKDDS
jgi:hypothetical protein